MDPFFSGVSVSGERLPAYAANIAKLLPALTEGGGASDALRLRRALQAVRRSRDAVARRYTDAANTPPACEWLLDNWYLAQSEGRAALRDLRRAVRQRGDGRGLLILALCRSLLGAVQGQWDAETCAAFLRGFQTVLPLRRRELLLFPAAMRAVLIEKLAEICDRHNGLWSGEAEKYLLANAKAI